LRQYACRRALSVMSTHACANTFVGRLIPARTMSRRTFLLYVSIAVISGCGAARFATPRPEGKPPGNADESPARDTANRDKASIENVSTPSRSEGSQPPASTQNSPWTVNVRSKLNALPLDQCKQANGANLRCLCEQACQLALPPPPEGEDVEVEVVDVLQISVDRTGRISRCAARTVEDSSWYHHRCEESGEALKRAEEACRQCNGQWGPHGIAQKPSCYCRTLDGGKPCNTSDECEGRCELAYELSFRFDVCQPNGCDAGNSSLQRPTGHCAKYHETFGCHAWIEQENSPNGPRWRVRRLCVD
jgi:hypothetical protein